MENATTNYNELMNASNDGTFNFYFNDKVRIDVNINRASITVTTDKLNAFLLDDVKTYFFVGGGMLGRPTLEQGFNKIIKSLTK